MLTLPEILHGLAASWDLFFGRDRGLAALRRDETGFWRSFLVFPLLLPFLLITLYFQSATAIGVNDSGEPVQSFSAFLTWNLFGALAMWVVPPAALALAARPLGISQGYVSYIVARNWISVLAAAIDTTPLLLSIIFRVPTPIVGFAMIIAWAIILRFHFIVARMALARGNLIAIVVILMELVISLLIFRGIVLFAGT